MVFLLSFPFDRHVIQAQFLSTSYFLICETGILLLVSLEHGVWNNWKRYLKKSWGVHVVAQQIQTQLVSKRMQVGSLASFSGSRIWCCHELWCRLHMQLRFGVAVVYAGNCSSDLTPSLGIWIWHGCGPEKKKKKEKKSCNIPNKTFFFSVLIFLCSRKLFEFTPSQK